MPDILESLKFAPQLVVDIRASQEIAHYLKLFQNKQVFQDDNTKSIIQAYFITRTGVLRIWRYGVDNYAKFFGQKFNPHRFFPERPYFWNTVQTRVEKSGLFDNETRPYIDLGGNGLIRTFCRLLRIAKGGDQISSEAMVCIDIAIPIDWKMLEEKLKPFGAALIASVSCSVVEQNVFCQSEKIEEKQMVENNLKQLVSQHQPEDMIGSVYVLPQGSSESNSNKREIIRTLVTDVLPNNVVRILGFLLPVIKKDVVYFTIPKELRPADPPREEFFLFKMDLGAPRWSSLIYAVLSIVCFGGALISLYFVREARRMSLAFVKNLDSVMEPSPVAFCHLDESDLFASFNKAFLA